MRAALLALLLIASPAFAETPLHPHQRQHRDLVEVFTSPVPRDECLKTVYLSAALKKERKASWAIWSAPITDATAQWIDWHLSQGNMRVFLCDDAPA